MKIYICGGGTGGHITPALSLYEEFRKRDYEDVTLIVGKRDLSMVPDTYRYRTLSIRRKDGVFGFIAFLFALIAGIITTFFLFLVKQPDLVIGTGGYMSVAPLVAARLLFKRVYLCEQNSVPGKANRALAKVASKVFLTFHKSKEYIPKGLVYGNPVRKEFYTTTRESARGALGIGANEKVLLVTGGSQGAQHVNDLILEAYPEIRDRVPGLTVLWLTGMKNYEEVAARVADAGYTAIRLYAYYERMQEMIYAADFAISRSGSSTISEFVVAGLPSLFIPFPYATDDHQYFNAKDIADAEASYLIREESLDKNKIVDILYAVFTEGERVARMRKQMAAFMPKHPEKRIADEIIQDAVETNEQRKK